jgi:hypothetical protein
LTHFPRSKFLFSPIVRLNRECDARNDRRFTVIPLGTRDWEYSRDYDIAVAPIDYKEGNRYLFIPTDRFLDEETARKNDVGIGDEVFMVGRFVTRAGVQKNNPSVRWGHVAMMPTEVVDDPDNPTEEEMCFTVEIHSIPGYSGSPVFVRPFPSPKLWSPDPASLAQQSLNTTTYTIIVDSEHRETGRTVDGGPWLLGIEKSYFHNYEHDELNDADVKMNTGMSCVVPAWHVLGSLNSKDMVQQRKEEQRRLLERYHQRGTTET